MPVSIAAAPSARTSRHVLTASTLGLALSCAATATATAQTTTPAPAQQLPAISVEGQGSAPTDYKVDRVESPRRTEPLVDTPATITIIPLQVIKDQAATTLRDVLRNTPGITFGAGEGGSGQGENLRIRGFEGSNDLLLDGMRDSAVLNSRDPFNLEQVEVTKGASGAISGRGAAGGSINQVSKTPKLNKFTEGSVTIGNADMKRATSDVNIPLPDIGIEGAALRLNVMAQESGVAGRDHVENNRWGVAPSIAFGLGTPLRIKLSYLHLDYDNVPDYGLPTINGGVIPPVDRSNWYGIAGFNTEQQTVDVGTAVVEYDVNDNISLRNQFRYGESTRFLSLSIPRYATGTTAYTPTTMVERGQNFRDSVNTVLANQTDATFRFGTGFAQHTLVTGLDLIRETYENKGISLVGTVPATSLYNPNPYGVAAGWAYSGARTENEATTVGVYALDTVKLGEKFEISGGLRWDSFKQEYTSIAAGTGARTEFDSDVAKVSWNVGAVYKPLPNGSVYAAASTSYRPSPQTENLQQGLNATTSNDDPEKTVNYEIGTKWELFNEKLMLSAALFHTTKTNERSTDVTGTTILDGERRVRGLELGATGKITNEWQVFGGYTFMDSEIVKGGGANQGNELANTPRHSFSLWTSYDLPWNLRVAGGVQYVGDRYFGDANTVVNESYFLVDAMASYQVTENFGIQLNGYNLFDKEYIDRASNNGGRVIPGVGRTVLVTGNVKF